uniref:Type II secretion system protein GspF domain-containing protein n=1 Tax=Tanacetum cinerariifolium TaxID=118510 RepID=A0A699GE50_TANCI|nr:conserved hypothetical protein [Tanacetum cinerariifolium]
MPGGSAPAWAAARTRALLAARCLSVASARGVALVLAAPAAACAAPAAVVCAAPAAVVRPAPAVVVCAAPAAVACAAPADAVEVARDGTASRNGSRPSLAAGAACISGTRAGAVAGGAAGSGARSKASPLSARRSGSGSGDGRGVRLAAGGGGGSRLNDGSKSRLSSRLGAAASGAGDCAADAGDVDTAGAASVSARISSNSWDGLSTSGSDGIGGWQRVRLVIGLARQQVAVILVVAVHAGVLDHDRPDEDHQLGLGAAFVTVREQVADHRHRGQHRDAVLEVVHAVLHQAAHHGDLAARHLHQRFQLARLDHRHAALHAGRGQRRIGIVDVRDDAGDGGAHVDGHFVVVRNLRRHAHDKPHRHRFQLGLVHGLRNRRAGAAQHGRRDLDREEHVVVHDLEQRGLVVHHADFRAGQDLDLAERFQQLDGRLQVAQLAGRIEVIERKRAGRRAHVDAAGQAVGAAHALAELDAAARHAGPVDALLVVITEFHFQHGRFDQHLPLGGTEHDVEEFADFFVLARGGAHGNQAALGIDDHGIGGGIAGAAKGAAAVERRWLLGLRTLRALARLLARLAALLRRWRRGQRIDQAVVDGGRAQHVADIFFQAVPEIIVRAVRDHGGRVVAGVAGGVAGRVAGPGRAGRARNLGGADRVGRAAAATGGGNLGGDVHAAAGAAGDVDVVDLVIAPLGRIGVWSSALSVTLPSMLGWTSTLRPASRASANSSDCTGTLCTTHQTRDGDRARGKPLPPARQRPVAVKRRLGNRQPGVLGADHHGVVGKRGQQRLVGQNVNPAHDTFGRVRNQPHRLRAEHGRAVVSGRSQPERQEFGHQFRRHGRHVETVGDAFLQLAHAGQGQVLVQFRLAEQHDLQQLAAGRFQVGQEPDRFQRVERHGLRFLDQQHHVPALAMAADQMRMQRALHFIDAVAARGQAQLGGNRVLHGHRIEVGVDQVNHFDMRRQLAFQHAAQHGLAGAHFAGDLDDALAVAHRVQQRRQNLAARIAGIEKRRVGRDAERGFAQAEVFLRAAVGRGAGKPDRAVVQDGHAVAQLVDVGQRVRRQKQGAARAAGGQAQLLGHALGIAAHGFGQRGGIEVERGQHGVHGGPVVRQSLQGQQVLEEVGAGQVIRRGEAFGQKAQRRAAGRAVVGLAENGDGAAVERTEIEQAFDQAGLAGAVDAHQAETLAWLQRQRGSGVAGRKRNHTVAYSYAECDMVSSFFIANVTFSSRMFASCREASSMALPTSQYSLSRSGYGKAGESQAGGNPGAAKAALGRATGPGPDGTETQRAQAGPCVCRERLHRSAVAGNAGAAVPRAGAGRPPWHAAGGHVRPDRPVCVRRDFAHRQADHRTGRGQRDRSAGRDRPHLPPHGRYLRPGARAGTGYRRRLGGLRRAGRQPEPGRSADRQAAAIGVRRCGAGARVRHPHRAAGRPAADPVPHRRRAAPADRNRYQDRAVAGAALKADVGPRHFRKTPAAGWPLCRTRAPAAHRRAYFHHAHPAWRIGGDALAEPGRHRAAARRHRHAARAGGEIPRHRAAPQRAGAGDGADRQRQDHHLVLRAGRAQFGGKKADHGGRPGGIPAGRHQPGAGQRQDRPQFCPRAALGAAAGPGHRAGGRDARPGNRADRPARRHDRSPGALDAAHQRCGQHAAAADGHGRAALHGGQFAAGRAGPAPDGGRDAAPPRRATGGAGPHDHHGSHAHQQPAVQHGRDADRDRRHAKTRGRRRRGLVGQAAGKESDVDGRAAVQPPAVHPAQIGRAHHARAGRAAGVGRQQIVRQGDQGFARVARLGPRTVGGHAPPSGRVFAILPVDGTGGRDDGPAGRGVPVPVRPPGIRPRHARARQNRAALSELCRVCHDRGHGGGEHLCDTGVRGGVCQAQCGAAVDDPHPDRHVQFHRTLLARDGGRHGGRSIITKATLARFARSFALSSRSGVPIVQALTVVSQTVDNAYLSARVEQMRDGVERGDSILRTAAAAGVFTPVVLQMIAVGEESGAIDDLMDEVAQMYEREVDYELKTLSSQIEPILIVFLGIMVLILALGIFLPIWDLGKAALRH